MSVSRGRHCGHFRCTTNALVDIMSLIGEVHVETRGAVLGFQLRQYRLLAAISAAASPADRITALVCDDGSVELAPLGR